MVSYVGPCRWTKEPASRSSIITLLVPFSVYAISLCIMMLNLNQPLRFYKAVTRLTWHNIVEEALFCSTNGSLTRWELTYKAGRFGTSLFPLLYLRSDFKILSIILLLSRNLVPTLPDTPLCMIRARSLCLDLELFTLVTDSSVFSRPL